jgi:hypothetical protein
MRFRFAPVVESSQLLLELLDSVLSLGNVFGQDSGSF